MTGLLSAREEIDRLIQGAPGQVGLVIKDVGTGDTLQWSAHERFAAASVIKIPVLVEAFRQVEAGRLRLDEPLSIMPEAKVPGFGVLKELQSVHSLSLLDMLTLMIIISDNVATNLCIERVGMAAVNETAASLGMRGTVLQRKMMDLAARDRGLDNFTTPADMALLLELLVTHRILTPSRCEQVLDILKRQQVNDRLPLHLPQGVPVAHKTGELAGMRHDVGILFLESGLAIVAALTQGFTSQLSKGLVGGEGSELIAQIGRIVLKTATSGA
jgi:beta-lactamase class A